MKKDPNCLMKVEQPGSTFDSGSNDLPGIFDRGQPGVGVSFIYIMPIVQSQACKSDFVLRLTFEAKWTISGAVLPVVKLK